MKTTLKFTFPTLEIRKNDAILTVGEGTSLEFQQEYAVEEVLEMTKSKPQIISSIKTAVKEIVECIGQYEKDTADIHYRNDERPYQQQTQQQMNGGFPHFKRKKKH